MLNVQTKVFNEEAKKRLDQLIILEEQQKEKINFEKTENINLSKKRRRKKYTEDAKLSEWVDCNQELFDSSKFKYMDVDKKNNCLVKSKNSEIEDIKKNQINNPIKFDYSQWAVNEQQFINLELNQIKNNKDLNECKVKKFCLYCDFIKRELNK